MGEKFLNVFLSNLDPTDAIKEEIKIDDSSIYGKDKLLEKIEARLMDNIHKAVMAEIPMGEPGAALIPNVYDQKKRKKEKELEDNAVFDLTRWSEEQQKKIEEELKRVYDQ